MHKLLIMAVAKTAFKTFFRIKTFLIVLNHVLFVSTITFELQTANEQRWRQIKPQRLRCPLLALSGSYADISLNKLGSGKLVGFKCNRGFLH